jgi:arylsulfatase A-like enzyme
MREGNWKLVKDMEDPGWELYDLSKDPCETNNLASTQPDRARKMLAEYQVWAAKVGVKEPKAGAKSE